MTPRAPDTKRVEALKRVLMCQADRFPEGFAGQGTRPEDFADLLAILDDHSALKAENERLKFEQVCLKNDNSALLMEFKDQRSIAQKLVLKVEEMKREQKKAEAELEKVKADFSEALKIGYDQQADLEKFRPLIEAVPELVKIINEEYEAVDGDERFHYPPANTDVNAPLALIQCHMEGRMAVLKKLRTALKLQGEGK